MTAPPSPKTLPGSKDRQIVLSVCGLLMATVFVIFTQTLWHDFVNFDDPKYFCSNPQVRAGVTWPGIVWAFQTFYASNWHPLTWLSLMLDAQLFGAGPMVPHLTNLLLHSANAVLLFLVLRRLIEYRSRQSISGISHTNPIWLCAFVAMAFAVHPLHVESVAWISERKDVLSGFFFLLTLWAYVRFAYDDIQNPQPNILRLNSRHFWLAILFFGLGLMSKPMLVTLPFVLLLLDYWPLQRFNPTPSTCQARMILHLLLEKLPFFLLSIGSCMITIFSQHEAVADTLVLPFFSRIGNALVAYAVYLVQTFFPLNLTVFYPHPGNGLPWWKIILSLSFLLGITVSAIRWRKRYPYVLVGWFWYVGMLVPVSGLLQVGGQARADRYTYLPLIGVFILIAWGTRDLFFWSTRRRMGAIIALIFLLAAWAGSAFIQTSYWRNSESLWGRALACTRRNAIAHNGLGGVFAEAGQNSEAVQQYRRALEINPNYVEAHNNIGIVLAREGQKQEAIQQYQRALEINPNYLEAHINLGNALAAEGETGAAADEYGAALQLDSHCVEAHNDWGAMLLSQDRIAEAMEHFQQAAALLPDDVEVQINLGTALVALGRANEAIDHYQKALQLKPDYAKAHFNLANIFAAQGRWDEAIEHYQQALEKMPDYNRGRYQLAVLLQRQGKFAEAMEQFQQILKRDPKHVAAQNNLAWLLATCPDNALRNGTQAVELAEHAVQLSGGKSPEILDTLAAAYAETGRFSEAISLLHQAIDLSTRQNNASLIETLQNQLRYFETNAPFREP